MRLLIIGPLEGYISAAGKIAISRGATVAHVDDIERGLAALRSGQGADLVMLDVKLDVARMVESLKQERIIVPVVACARTTVPPAKGFLSSNEAMTLRLGPAGIARAP